MPRSTHRRLQAALMLPLPPMKRTLMLPSPSASDALEGLGRAAPARRVPPSLFRGARETKHFVRAGVHRSYFFSL